MRRLASIRKSAAHSLEYARTLEATPADERNGWPALRLFRLPLCWLRGHVWPSRGGAIEISPYLLAWCERCGEEICHRTRWAQLEARPIDDEDLPWFGDEDLEP